MREIRREVTRKNAEAGATEKRFALSGTSRRAPAGFAFELDEDKMHRLIANVLRGVSQRVAKNNVAGLECALGDLAVCCVVAIPASRQNVNDVGGVRVHLLFGTGWQDSFEDADSIVFEPDAYR